MPKFGKDVNASITYIYFLLFGHSKVCVSAVLLTQSMVLVLLGNDAA